MKIAGVNFRQQNHRLGQIAGNGQNKISRIGPKKLSSRKNVLHSTSLHSGQCDLSGKWSAISVMR